LNGFVTGGPKASSTFQTLQSCISDSSDYVESELQRRIYTRAAMRLHLAIVRQSKVKTQRKSTDEENNSKNNKKDNDDTLLHPTNSDTMTPILVSQISNREIFPTEKSSKTSLIISPEMVLSDLMFASSVAISIATVESLRGTPMYNTALYNIFRSLISVFSSTIKSVR
jgi:hypothetical protein